MDFTLSTYSSLLATLLSQDYFFFPLEKLPFHNTGKTIVLRHDVDKLPGNALQTAILENKLGIRGTYYFRIVPQSNKPAVIEKICELGHEIGYHYEDLTITRGNMDLAYEAFLKNLSYFRSYYPVKTICMHGSPLSKWDSRDIWNKFSYRDQGIICEPYLDIDFNKVFYLTDTARRWDGWHLSVRDKMPMQNEWISQNLVFRYTRDIILAALQNSLPHQIMITIHPQRWTNKSLPWLKELLLQSAKNKVKYFIAR